MKTKKIIIVFIVYLVFISLICADAIVKINEPSNSPYCEGYTIPIEIDVIPQFGIFGEDDNGNFYFLTEDIPGAGHPLYHCRSNQGHQGVDIMYSSVHDSISTRPIFAPTCGIVKKTLNYTGERSDSFFTPFKYLTIIDTITGDTSIIIDSVGAVPESLADSSYTRVDSDLPPKKRTVI